METKLLMGITSYRQIPSICFAHHMTNLIDAAKFGFVKRLEIEQNLYVTVARNKIAANAVKLWKEGEISHLLYVDDDVLIPQGGIRQLVNTKMPIVSGLYFTRELLPCVFDFMPNFHQIKEIPETGIIKADAAGAGALLIDCAILQQMVDKYNDNWWFQNAIEKGADGEDHYQGEDIFFFRRLKEMGIPVAINCDVKCDHVSTSITNYKTYLARRDADKAKKEQETGAPLDMDDVLPSMVAGLLNS